MAPYMSSISPVYSDLHMATSLTVFIIAFYCDFKSTLIYATFTICILSFYLRNFNDLGPEYEYKPDMFRITGIWVVIISGTTLIASCFTYLEELQIKLRSQVTEHNNLINYMKEGVLVISKDIKRVLFYNRTIRNIFD